MNKLSGSQVDKLGRCLRNVVTPSVKDLRLLEQVRRAHEDARLEVVQTLMADGLQGTSRLKTTSTIIEKLRRESTMHLSRMHDIAGVRLVIEGSRIDQDRVVKRIRGLFPDSRSIDRRAKPSYGYRAVHVIVRTQGCLVEVQVRTRVQDTWAQIVERLADVFGRQIRYGEPPSDPDVEVVPDLTRQALISLLISLSKTNGELEERDAALAQVEREAEETGGIDAEFLTMVSEERAEIVQAERKTHDVLERLHAVLQRAQAIGTDGLS